MPRVKKELAEQIIPRLREFEAQVGRSETGAEVFKKIGKKLMVDACLPFGATGVAVQAGRRANLDRPPGTGHGRDSGSNPIAKLRTCNKVWPCRYAPDCGPLTGAV